MNYIAITIGPIYKTFQYVRKTRELWAASYMFSYISKRLVEKIQEIAPGSVIIPHYNEKEQKGIGLYPDRIYMKQIEKIKLADIEKIKATILEEILEWLPAPKNKHFMEQYFRIYNTVFSTQQDENPVVEANKILDVAELKNIWQLEETDNPLLHFFREVNTIKIDDKKWINNHLQERDIFGHIRFESLPEISTRAIRNLQLDKYKELVKKYCYTDTDLDDEDGFVMELQKSVNKKGTKEIFRNYHKYVCIVKADGDKVGKYLAAIKTNHEAELAAFSEKLHDWGKASAQLIQNYSGIPVYIGGDDLLFFAPVVGYSNQSILDLATSLVTCFSQYLEALPPRKDDEDKPIKPTLSFGISITYYKYPLYEALNKAEELLHNAKEIRNACSVSLLKHSGSSFDIRLSNDTADPVSQALANANKHFANDSSFVSSVIHHFRENEAIYRIIGKEEAKVVAYLRNNFEEKAYKDFVDSIAALCYAVYKQDDGASDKKRSEKSIQKIYSFLRILKFLNGQDDGK